MAYNDYSAFEKDFNSAQKLAREVHGDIPQTKVLGADIGWNLYSQATKPALGFHVLGRHITGEKAKELQNLRMDKGKTVDLPPHMWGITKSPFDQMQKNFGYVNDAGDGSILMMGGDKWNFTINDTWVVAGVNSKLPFYAASVVSRQNVYDTKYYLSITGREIFGLAIFGYKQTQRHASLGVCFECEHPKMAENATLTLYQQAMAQVKGMQYAAAVFKQAGFSLV